MDNKIFNIIITGVGGQGLITLLQLLARIALNKGLEVRTSELHGLSQRGGSVSVHLRFGKQVFSTMVGQGKSDLILDLEQQEALSAAYFAFNKTIFLINQYQTPTLGETVSEKRIKSDLAKVSKKVFFLPANEICQKQLGSGVVAGMFLLGWAVKKGFLKFSDKEVIEAIKQTMPEKFWDLNIKALELCKSPATTEKLA